MNRPQGRPPKTREERERLGNVGHRPLPAALTVLLGPATDVPDPDRPLGVSGRALWTRLWTCGATWLVTGVDDEVALMLCETLDERQALRLVVLRDKSWRERAALRQVEDQILDLLSSLGFSPVARARLGLASIRPAPSAFDELAARRRTGPPDVG